MTINLRSGYAIISLAKLVGVHDGRSGSQYGGRPSEQDWMALGYRNPKWGGFYHSDEKITISETT